MCLFPTLLAGALAHAGASAPVAPARTAEGQDLMALYCAGAEKMFVDPKDAALLEALKMIDDRVAELPREMGDDAQLPPDVMPLVARVLSGPLTLRIRESSEPVPGMPIPLSVQLSMPGIGAAEAATTSERMGRLLEMAGMGAPEVGENGLASLPLPVPAWYGARGDDFLLAIGETQSDPVQFSGAGLPSGVEPVFGMRMNYGMLLQLLGNMAEMTGEPELAVMHELLVKMGLADMRFSVVSGHDDHHAYSTVLMPGYAAVMREQGTIPEAPLAEGTLRMIPEDATWASVGALNLSGSVNMLRSVMTDSPDYDPAQDPIELLANFTGIHLERDVIDQLGSDWGMYASDSTGGSGLLSAVAFMELKEGSTLTETTGRLEQMLNGMARAMAKGYVQTRHWERDGHEYTSLTFPGLPVPMEPTCAIAGGYMIMGVTPQAAIGAVQQATHGDHSLLDNKSFRENLIGGVEDCYAIYFVDTPKLARSGYGVMSVLCSALANGTRSPRDASRNAGLVLPSYHDLLAGAVPSVGVTRIDGADWVQKSRGDRSILVNLTGGVGFVTSSPLMMTLLTAVPMGIAMENEMSSKQNELYSLRHELQQLRAQQAEELYEEDDDSDH